MEVELLAFTPNPDRICAAAAFTSWKKHSTKELFEELSDKEAFDFLKMVIGFGHLSVTEHANFTFAVKGMSRACSHQVVRHRIAAYTQQSQRYVEFDKQDLEVVTPHTIRKNEEASRKFAELNEKIKDVYVELVKLGIPPEDARYVLPNAAATNMAITMNGRELLHFFKLRCCLRAQWEIKELADEMLKKAKKVSPVLFAKAGPSCVQLGYCTEGELTCGKIVEVKKQYAEL
ncbi:FAD-dependent thymidylate synthase [Candidatus Micrarchaeota archaeon]|nr:FAD-dependent thymidylate synthase [Candidatus Micrarchaeota archaeon]